MKLILSTMHSPRRTAERMKSRPRWLSAFLVLTILSAICYGVMHPYLVRSTLAHLPPGATAADKQFMADTLDQELPVKLAFLPMRVFGGWAAFSLALFHICRAFAPREMIRFTQVFSLEVHSEATSVVASVAGVVLTLSNPIVNAEPVSIPMSILNLAGQDQDFVFTALFSSLNVFALWQCAILSVGVSVLCGFGRMKSVLVVALAWGFAALFNLATLKIVQDELHLVL